MLAFSGGFSLRIKRPSLTKSSRVELDIALTGFKNYSRPNFLFSQDEIKCLKDLSNDSNIVIVNPDKGNGVVILDSSDYNRKMEDILSDTSLISTLA